MKEMPAKSRRTDRRSSTSKEEGYQLRILTSLRRIIRGIEVYSRKLESEFKVTGPQLMCLNLVAEGGKTTATAIAQKMHVSTSTLVGILDRLEKKGLISRERDTTDRRQYIISATADGKKIARKSPSPIQDKLADGLEKLSKKDRSTIAESLDRIVELMEVEHVDAAPVLNTGSIEADPGSS